MKKEYLQLGFSIIPLGEISKDKDGNKIIAYPVPWKKYQTVKATEAEALAWTAPNLGICTGRISNLVVLDLDSYKPNYDAELVKSFNLPVTPCQQTASGGRQYFFAYPKGKEIKNAVCIGTKDSGIDIRGDGGMVIAPPTVTSYGEYSWIVSPFDTPLAELPPKLLEMLVADSKPEKHRKTLPELVALSEGEGRDNAMASLVGKLLYTLPENKWVEDVWPIALQVNQTYKPPLSQHDLKRIFDSVSGIELKRRQTTDKKEPDYPPTVSLTELMDTVFPEIRFCVAPFFEQGTVNMITAPPNNWKSWVVFLFAMRVAEGKNVFGHDKFTTQQSKVFIVNEEDSSRLIQDRLKMMSLTDKTLPIFFRVAHGAKLTTVFVDKLIAEAKEKEISVIFFDSLRSIHDANENDSQEMQKVMDLMKKISREGITVIFTHHHRKKPSFGKQDEAEASRGSTGINASISGHLSLCEVKRENETYIIFQHLKSKVTQKEDPFEILVKYTKNEKGDIQKIDFEYAGKYKANEQKLLATKDSLMSTLKVGYWQSAKELFELKIAGMSNVRQALSVLKKEGLILSMNRKQLAEKNIAVDSVGKPNENLYSLNSETPQEEVSEDPLDADW